MAVPTSAATDVLAEPLAPAPEPEPPARDLTPREWVRANLASSPLNAVLTVLVGLGVAWLVYRLVRWVFVTADWAIVRVNLRLFMVGQFPTDQLWRLWVAGYILVATVGLAVGAVRAGLRKPVFRGVDQVDLDDQDGQDDVVRDTASDGGGTGASGRDAAPDGEGQIARPRPWLAVGSRAVAAMHRFWPAAVAVVAILSLTRTVPPIVGTIGLVVVGVAAGAVGARLPGAVRRWAWLFVVAGLVAGLQVIIRGDSGVGWDDWGGLHLAVSATLAGIALAFPLGLLLALGRRSSLPGLRVVSIGYIEAFRAVPLVALLFMGIYMIGFMFPTTVEPPSFLVRAVIAITLFEAAYIAEIVRGGLQAVPRGQIEAAQAIGLSPTKAMRLVVLPQALRAVIPAMVGQFISLFKDTSLLSIVGFLEMLDVVNIVAQQPDFQGQGLRPVALAFVGLIYWAGCSTMSRESQRLERRLGVGER
jgi:general L-amino acid transport system permease protein